MTFTHTEMLVAATLAAARIQLKTGTVSASSAVDSYIDCLLELKKATHEATGAKAYVACLRCLPEKHETATTGFEAVRHGTVSGHAPRP